MMNNKKGDVRALNIMISVIILIFLFVVFFLIIKIISLDKAEKITAEIKKQTITTELNPFLQKKSGERTVADLILDEDYPGFVKELKDFFHTNKCFIKINEQKISTSCENPTKPEIKTSLILPTYSGKIKNIYLEIE